MAAWLLHRLRHGPVSLNHFFHTRTDRTMRKILIAAAALAALISSNAGAAISPRGDAADSPYAGQENRGIKALSAAEIDGLLQGKGLGFAKAAELNHYPGPVHVIEIARKIGLSDTQLAGTKSLYRSMKREAAALGRKIVDMEKELDRLFGSGTVTETSLRRTVGGIARLRGTLRATHLRYHLKMKKLLSPHQIVLYDRARGYGGGNDMNMKMHNRHMGK